MSGGGGSFFPGKSAPEELRKQTRELEDDLRSQEYVTTVCKLLADLLQQAKDQNPDARNTHLDEIKKALGKEIEGEVDLRFGGSVAKHTYVDGLSDIDALVVLNKSELAQEKPEAVKSYFAERLQERFPNTQIAIGRLAVTLKFDDGEIQLLPAIRTVSRVRIPSASGVEWSSVVRPASFARKLTQTNQARGGKLIPTIKLAKSVISQEPEQRRLSGYHVESLAIRAFENYQDSLAPKAMLTHFFSYASAQVMKPMADTTGQSYHVDDYLGRAGSLERRLARDSLNRIARQMRNADGAQSVDQWRRILGK